MKYERNKKSPQKILRRETLKYLLIIDFPKFDPLTATGMDLCVNLGPK
jgi:hypothetical protein